MVVARSSNLLSKIYLAADRRELMKCMALLEWVRKTRCKPKADRDRMNERLSMSYLRPSRNGNGCVGSHNRLKIQSESISRVKRSMELLLNVLCRWLIPQSKVSDDH